MSKRLQGRVQRLVADKNFGFVQSDDEPFVRFFHAGEMAFGAVPFEDVEVGDHVTFTPVLSDGRARAERVVVIGKAGDAEMSAFSSIPFEDC